jgi:hypothetical protein
MTAQPGLDVTVSLLGYHLDSNRERKFGVNTGQLSPDLIAEPN